MMKLRKGISNIKRIVAALLCAVVLVCAAAVGLSFLPATATGGGVASENAGVLGDVKIDLTGNADQLVGYSEEELAAMQEPFSLGRGQNLSEGTATLLPDENYLFAPEGQSADGWNVDVGVVKVEFGMEDDYPEYNSASNGWARNDPWRAERYGSYAFLLSDGSVWMLYGSGQASLMEVKDESGASFKAVDIISAASLDWLDSSFVGRAGSPLFLYIIGSDGNVWQFDMMSKTNSHRQEWRADLYCKFPAELTQTEGQIQHTDYGDLYGLGSDGYVYTNSMLSDIVDYAHTLQGEVYSQADDSYSNSVYRFNAQDVLENGSGTYSGQTISSFTVSGQVVGVKQRSYAQYLMQDYDTQGFEPVGYADLDANRYPMISWHAVLSDGTLWSTGYNYYGQLGLYTQSESNIGWQSKFRQAMRTKDETVPDNSSTLWSTSGYQGETIPLTGVEKVAASPAGTAVLCSDGSVWNAGREDDKRDRVNVYRKVATGDDATAAEVMSNETLVDLHWEFAGIYENGREDITNPDHGYDLLYNDVYPRYILYATFSDGSELMTKRNYPNSYQSSYYSSSLYFCYSASHPVGGEMYGVNVHASDLEQYNLSGNIARVIHSAQLLGIYNGNSMPDSLILTKDGTVYEWNGSTLTQAATDISAIYIPELLATENLFVYNSSGSNLRGRAAMMYATVDSNSQVSVSSSRLGANTEIMQSGVSFPIIQSGYTITYASWQNRTMVREWDQIVGYGYDMTLSPHFTAGNTVSVIQADGSSAEYPSLRQAFENAEDGATIKLIQNTRMTEADVSPSAIGIPNQTRLTLDLNGYLLDVAIARTLFTLYESAELTVADSRPDVERGFTKNAENNRWEIDAIGGEFTVTGGVISPLTYSGDRANGLIRFVGSDSTFRLNGGNFIGFYYSLNASNTLDGAIIKADAPGNHTIEVNGGRVAGNASGAGNARQQNSVFYGGDPACEFILTGGSFDHNYGGRLVSLARSNTATVVDGTSASVSGGTISENDLRSAAIYANASSVTIQGSFKSTNNTYGLSAVYIYGRTSIGGGISRTDDGAPVFKDRTGKALVFDVQDQYDGARKFEISDGYFDAGIELRYNAQKSVRLTGGYFPLDRSVEFPEEVFQYNNEQHYCFVNIRWDLPDDTPEGANDPYYDPAYPWAVYQRIETSALREKGVVTYDGKRIVAGTDFEVQNDGNVAVTYSYSGTFSDSGLPKYAGEYTISGHFARKVSGADRRYYPEKTATLSLTINKATLTDNTEDVTATYDGTAKSISLNISGFNDGYDLSTALGAQIRYGTSSGNYNLTSNPTVTNVADSKTIYYQITFANYNTITGSKKITINKATLTDNTKDVTATYDGTAKSISLNISGFISGQNLSNAAGVQTRYGTSSGTYNLTSHPTVTNVADSKTIYYQITFDNYNTITGSKRITINRANLTANDFRYASPSDLIFSGTNKAATVTFSAAGKTGCGNVTVKYSSNASKYQAATPLNVGTYYVYIDVAQGANYNAASNLRLTNWSFAITKATLTDGVKNVLVDYDAAAHALDLSGVTGWKGSDSYTSALGLKVEYSTNGSSWSTTPPSATTVAQSTDVYFRITTRSRAEGTRSRSRRRRLRITPRT